MPLLSPSAADFAEGSHVFPLRGKCYITWRPFFVTQESARMGEASTEHLSVLAHRGRSQAGDPLYDIFLHIDLVKAEITHAYFEPKPEVNPKKKKKKENKGKTSPHFVSDSKNCIKAVFPLQGIYQ